jgi:hypothetical protein
MESFYLLTLLAIKKEIPMNIKNANKPTFLRLFFAAFLAFAGLSYTFLVIAGYIPESRQLSGTHLTFLTFLSIAVVILVSPESLKRLKLLELSGFKLELLERVREKQIEQAQTLDTISLVVPLLLPKKEQKHLLNLSVAKTGDYQGGHILRSELRRLRSVGLIRMTNKGYVAELTSDKRFNLARYVELTELGQRWANQISQLEDKRQSEQ